MLTAGKIPATRSSNDAERREEDVMGVKKTAIVYESLRRATARVSAEALFRAGLEAELVQLPGVSDWAVVVAEKDYARALAVLHDE